MRIMSVIFAMIVCPSGPGLVWAEVSSEHAERRKRVVLSAGQEVQGDYFAFGPHVEISGTVHGDVYAAGGKNVRYWSDGEPSIDEGAAYKEGVSGEVAE